MIINQITKMQSSDQSRPMNSGNIFEFLNIVAYSVVLKILLFPTYHSTDFEVHRNWLAITHSLPVSKWYFEDTSQWTLDYPPLFAWFEYFLSHFASLIDPKIVDVQNLEYATLSTVVFQRSTVIVSDMVLVYACFQYSSSFTKTEESHVQNVLRSILVIFNFGLFIVDHYNGFLFGILILSITRMLEGKFLWSAFWFSVLLNFKHIYLYIAPAYFVYLLRWYCIQHVPYNASTLELWKYFSPMNFIKLGSLVVTVFFVSFGPFVAMGQLGQVLNRLFPFKRGLCHAYWAPNFWALYNILDKLLTFLGTKLDLVSLDIKPASLTSGLVGHSHHTVLPPISPFVTVLLTVFSMLPCLVKLWFRPRATKAFLYVLVLCAYSSFIFGWHVHEKAILLITLPLSLLAFESVQCSRIFIIVSAAGNFSLFPLLFQENEIPIKIVLMIMFTLLTFWSVEKGNSLITWSKDILTWFEKCYLLGLVILQIYVTFIHERCRLSITLPFFPLLLTSVYCAVGVTWSWILFYKTFLFEIPIKIVLMIMFTLLTFWSVEKGNSLITWSKDILTWFEKCYLLGLVILQIYVTFIHERCRLSITLPFFPLLLTSVYCAVGVTWSWILFYKTFLFDIL